MIEEKYNTSNVTEAASTAGPRRAQPATSRQYIIRSRAQVRALASPARQEVVDALVAAGPCSVAELAAHTGRAPDSLYFHVNRLVKVGLVVEQARRPTGKRPAAVFDVPGRPLTLAYDDVRASRDLGAVVSSSLRLADRDFGRAMKLGFAVVEGPRRNVWGGRAKGWVGPSELEEINRLFARVLEIIHGGRPGEGRQPQSLTFVLAPVRANQRAPRPGPCTVTPAQICVTERNGES